MDNELILGIVAEYNPFHNGHLFQLKAAKKQANTTGTIAVISGNFVQRGDISIMNKWTRAKLAVENGVDLVLELPTAFTLRSAEHFAHGSMNLLKSTGLVSHISFGCETDDFNSLNKIVSLTENKSTLKEYISINNYTYIAAINKILSDYDKSHNSDLSKIAQLPNNVLAIEYLKALKRLSFNPTILPIKRIGSNYNEKELKLDFASASAIRNEFFKSGASSKLASNLPKNTYQALALLESSKHYLNVNTLDILFSYLLKSQTPESIFSSCECSEGLENKIFKARTESTFEEILNSIKSKRYPLSRIKRLLLQLLLSKKNLNFKNIYPKETPYIRILAFNDKGRQMLKKMKKTATAPIITKLNKNILESDYYSLEFKKSLALDINATNIYSILTNNSLTFNTDYLASPIYYKNKQL